MNSFLEGSRESSAISKGNGTLRIERFSRKHFALFFASIWLALSIGAVLLFRFLPTGTVLLVMYGSLWIAATALTFVTYFSERSRQLALHWLSGVWGREWLCWMLAFASLGIYFAFLWYIRSAYREFRLTLSFAFAAFTFVAALAVAVWLAPVLTAPQPVLGIRARRVLLFAVLVLLIGFGFYLWGANLYAGWWILDDHYIIEFIGRTAYMPLDHVVPILVSNGQVIPFAAGRLRPVFWIFQALEAVIWGDQPFLWYFFRIGIFILASLATWRLLKPLLGGLNSFLFTLFLLSFRFWGGIFTRLGTAETYALLALTGYSLAVVQLLTDSVQTRRLTKWQVRGLWALLGLSALVCMGAKENFLVLLLPNVLLLLYLVWKRKLSLGGIIALGISTGYGLIAFASLLSKNAERGVDEYGNSVQVTSRLEQVFTGFESSFLTRNQFLEFACISLIVAGGILFLWRRRDGEGLHQVSRDVLRSVLVAVALLALAVSQLYFYNGSLPQSNHYDFPFALVQPFWGLIGLLLLLAIVSKTLKRPFVTRFVSLLIAMSLGGWIFLGGYEPARAASADNVERTQRFASDLALIESTARQDPNIPIIFDTHSGTDYGASYSVSIFLRHDGVTNPFFLRYAGIDPLDADPPLRKIMANHLYRISNGAEASPYYAPFTEFRGDSCYGIGFSGASAPPCTFIVRIWK